MGKKAFAFLTGLFLFAGAVLATSTQFNVITQVKGILGLANGGTGSATGLIPGNGTVLLTALSATHPIAPLCGISTGQCNTAGQYVVSWNFWGSGTPCSSITAGQVTLALTWTDENSIAHSGVIMLMNTQTAATTVTSSAFFHFETALANEGAGGDFVVSSNGAAAIQYTLTYTPCTTGTGTYNFRGTVKQTQ